MLTKKAKYLIYTGAVLFLIFSSISAKCSDKIPSWKFAVMCDTRGSDTGINKYILENIAESIAENDCEFVLIPGDMIDGCYNPSDKYSTQFDNWKASIAPILDKKIKIYPVRGNHEVGRYIFNNPKQPPYTLLPDPLLHEDYLIAFSKIVPSNGPENEKGLTYFVKHKNVFFVALDQYVNIYRNNLIWIKKVFDKELDREKTPNVFAFGHNPAFVVGHEDCLAYYYRQRDEFWNLLGSAGCRVYFCGHDHLYNRASVKDDNGNTIYQVLAGSGGAPFAAWKPPYKDNRVKGEFHNDKDYGYMLVTIDGNNVSMKWMAFDVNGNYKWTTPDSFSYKSPVSD